MMGFVCVVSIEYRILTKEKIWSAESRPRFFGWEICSARQSLVGCFAIKQASKDASCDYGTKSSCSHGASLFINSMVFIFYLYKLGFIINYCVSYTWLGRHLMVYNLPKKNAWPYLISALYVFILRKRWIRLTLTIFIWKANHLRSIMQKHSS